jgi:hypothetical protein
MHKHTDPASAATELLKRRSIRNSLTEWAHHKGFEPAPHHQLFIREIEAFLKSEDEVLLLFAPPSWCLTRSTAEALPGPSIMMTASRSSVVRGWKFDRETEATSNASTAYRVPRAAR